MNTALTALLDDLAARGIVIAAEGDRLKIDAPAGALTAELRRALAEHKPALLAHLAAPAAPVPLGRIPLADLGGYLARHGLRVVGGAAYPDGRTFRPTLYLAKSRTPHCHAERVCHPQSAAAGQQ